MAGARAVGVAVAAAAAAAAVYVLRKRAREDAAPSAALAAAVVDLSAFLSNPESAAAKEACAQLAKSLLDTGIVILKDPRVSDSDSSAFLDMMEDYFAQPTEAKMADVRAELHHQVGATPSHVEIPICKADAECTERISKMPKQHRPYPITGPDPKWRFFWRIGERPVEVNGFEDLNAAPVVPAAFAGQWEGTMNHWGTLMLQAVTTCAQMAAEGFGLPRDALSSLMDKGPHLLAPTGSDLTNHRQVGTVLAGWHNDLNLLTIHGKSRYPGLFVWLKDGSKMSVKIPDGCLLVQAGQQLEHLTGGAVHAGMHEVVVLDATVAAAERQAAKARPQWRVSSTLFAHVASRQTMRPLGPFATDAANAAYQPITAGEQVMEVLKKISLSKP